MKLTLKEAQEMLGITKGGKTSHLAAACGQIPEYELRGGCGSGVGKGNRQWVRVFTIENVEEMEARMKSGLPQSAYHRSRNRSRPSASGDTAQLPARFVKLRERMLAETGGAGAQLALDSVPPPEITADPIAALLSDLEFHLRRPASCTRCEQLAADLAVARGQLASIRAAVTNS